MARDAHGLVFVFNPDSTDHARQLDNFYQAFVKQAEIEDDSCVVFANFQTDTSARRGVKLSGHFSRIPQLEVTRSILGKSEVYIYI